MATLTAAPVRPPLVAWVRRHLLSGPLNTLLTLVFGAVFVAAGMAVVRFLANSDFTILRVNLALFFQVTAVFLAVFVVQLIIYGLHELTEANLFPGSEALHWATEPYGPDGRYGQFLTYLLVLLPLGWLAFAAFFGGNKPIRQMPPEAAAR